MLNKETLKTLRVKNFSLMQCAGKRQPTVLRVKLAAKTKKLKKKKTLQFAEDSTMKISEGKTTKLTV